MRKFNKITTARKALATALKFGAAFAAGIAAVEIPTDPGALEAAAPGIVIAVIAAAARAYGNMDKNRDKPGNPLGGPHYPSRYLWPVLAALGLGGLLAGCLQGCVTTTLPDGTVIQSADVGALREAYDVYERERARRESLGQSTEGLAVHVDGRLWDADSIREELARYGVVLPD